MTRDNQVEKEIQEKGLTAPRVTLEQIESKITGEEYHVFEGTQLTVCVLTLQNGFTVSGESACASPENFDAELGRKIARRNAQDKIWALEGYLLKEKLSNQGCFISRMKTELEELLERIHKLDEFMKTQEYFNLSSEKRNLIYAQFGPMSNYARILRGRHIVACLEDAEGQI